MSNRNKGSVVLPGLSEYIKKTDDEWFWEDEKKVNYFDATELPDSPNRQMTAEGSQTYVMYVIFPTLEELTRAITAFTKGKRKSLAPGSKTASLNGIHRLENDQTLLEMWEEALAGHKLKKKKVVNVDEAQAPIE